MVPRNSAGSTSDHPTVGVALFGPEVSDQLSSSSEELTTSQDEIFILQSIRFRTSAYK